MGIFTRFRDIVSSNISAMLDSAEDPEKLIRLMIREIEDTLVDLKSSCAGAIAGREKVRRRLEELRNREAHWSGRAELAVEKGRDDLAREALLEKRRFSTMIETLEKEMIEHEGIVDQYKVDIRQLEDKLCTVVEKKRVLVQRHIRAKRKKSAKEEIRKANSGESLARFDDLENRIERMEAEADLVDMGSKCNLEEQFEELCENDDIEKELASLKAAKDDVKKDAGV